MFIPVMAAWLRSRTPDSLKSSPPERNRTEQAHGRQAFVCACVLPGQNSVFGVYQAWQLTSLCHQSVHVSAALEHSL